MNNLLKLIQKYKALLVFLFFQVICFALIFNQNNFHKSSIINSSNSFTGGLYNAYNNATTYFNLKEENENLNAENAHLKTLLKGYNITEYNTFSIVNDSIKKLNYQITSAKIINSFTKGEQNYLTINLGSENGVETQMSVVNSDGIIGFVKDVSSHYATVVPIIHRDFLISIVHKESNALGLLKWTDDNNYSTATAINLPKYVGLKKGDEIVSKGNDGVFIPNEPIGTIESIFVEDGSDYISAIIKLHVDYKSVSHVYVVKNLFKGERKALEEKLDD